MGNWNTTRAWKVLKKIFYWIYQGTYGLLFLFWYWIISFIGFVLGYFHGVNIYRNRRFRQVLAHGISLFTIYHFAMHPEGISPQFAYFLDNPGETLGAWAIAIPVIGSVPGLLKGKKRTKPSSGSSKSRRPPDKPVNVELPNGISRSSVSNPAIKSKLRIVEKKKANDVNSELKKRGGDKEDFHPPFAPGTVNVYELKDTAYFVRFSGGVEAYSKGRYVMRLDDVQGLTEREIRNRFAIPTYRPNAPKEKKGNSMEELSILEIHPGTSLYSGATNGHPKWGSGGGVQYLVRGKDLDDYVGKIITINNW